VIELDGGGHYDPEAERRDGYRTMVLERYGLKVLRFCNLDVDRNFYGVCTVIDEEVKRMINEQYTRAKELLSKHKEGHNQLAQLLVEKEVIFAEDVEQIFGKRPWASRSEEIMNNEEKKQIDSSENKEELLLENKEA
jgi:bifunctional DNA-binding transcriptional regulator/antitoxin component of YhaV-PrlF toxin-antitoxin module